MHLDVTDHDRSHILPSSNSRERILKCRELYEVCADNKKDYDGVRSAVLLGASCKIAKAVH